MKTKIDFGEFKKAVKEVNKLKNTSDINTLDNIKLIAKDEYIKIIKSNLTSILQVKCYAENEEPGEIILPNSTIKLLENIKKNQELTITDEYIQLGKKKIEFKDITLEDFPKIEFKANNKKFSIAENELYRLLEVSYATAKDETRPILTGINIKNNKFAAIDGYRLSIRESDKFTSDLNITMSNEQWTALLKIINKKSNNTINVYTDCDNKYLRYEINDNIELESELMEGEYIKYESIIPETKESNTTLHIDDDEIMDKFNLINKLNDKNVYTEININDIIEIKAKDQENIIKDELKGNVKGENILIAFNNKYLIDSFKYYEKDKFNIYLYSSVSPIVVTQDNKSLELILPVRLNKAA